MRISDWSSDVCSADLLGRAAVDHSRGQRGENTDIGRRGQYAKGQSGRLLALFHPDPGKRHAGSRGGGPVRPTPQELGKSGHCGTRPRMGTDLSKGLNRTHAQAAPRYATSKTGETREGK